MLLVTGAAGLNGLAIVREFARQGVSIRALVRDRSRASALEGLPYVEIVEGDMSRPETLGRALKDVERALMISSAGPDMEATQRAFVDASKAAGVRHVIKFSGEESGIGFEPSAFRSVQMHEDIEDYLEVSGLAWTHLRPSQFMQIYLREVPTIIASRELRLPMDDSQMAPVDIEDIAKVAFALLTQEGHEGKRYVMTGPEALTMAEIATRISEAINETVRYVNVSLEQKKQAWLNAGVPAERAEAFSELFAERRKRPLSRVSLETHERFGIRPTTFAEFAQRHAAVFRGEAVRP